MDRRSFCRTVSGSGTALIGFSGLLSSSRRGEAERAPGAQNSPGFLYILRLAMAPGHQEKERTSALLSFCREARIDDVAFILWAEELNSGHPTPQETDLWLEMVERVKPQLASIGVTTSLNPWVVLLHADRGRKLKAGQRFHLMVDQYGREATATGCPLSPDLREHLRRHFERLARVQPRMIWVDDDFRLHNHAPLQWGGCFCELHMQEYSRRAGRPLTREEFVHAVLQPGEPHPFRRIWLETGRDTMVDLARLLGQAVHRVSPGTQVGLMSSNPAVHCVEGRDWEGVLRGLAAGHAPVNRPHLPSYAEVSAPAYLWNFSRISRLSTAMVPSDTRLFPELENWPHSRFSKSKSFTRFQVESVAALGAEGIAMDIFDLFGNGVIMQEGHGPALAEAKSLAVRLRGLGLGRERETGVQVLFNRRASGAVRTERGESFSELEPRETFWASFLAVMGIAHTYREWSSLAVGPVAVSGQYFRGLSQTQIQELLSNRVVLLVGNAVSTLVQMGLGGVLGIRQVEWSASDSGLPSYEQVVDDKVYAGLHDARLTAQALTGAYLRIDYDNSVVIHTEVHSPEGNRIGPGMAVVNGRAIVLPYRPDGDSLGLRHPVRQELIQGLLAELGGEHCPVFLRETANVAVFSYAVDSRLIVLLVNASGDGYEVLRIRCGGVQLEGAQEVSAAGARRLGEDLTVEGDSLLLRTGLPRLGVKALVLGRGKSRTAASNPGQLAGRS